MHLGGLVMGLIKLGDYIERSTKNNNALEYGTEFIAGVNTSGVFAPPKGSTEGVNLKPYKIVNDGAFVYNPTRLELGSIAYRTDGLCIVSHLYMVFYLTEEGKKLSIRHGCICILGDPNFAGRSHLEILEVRDRNLILMI